MAIRKAAVFMQGVRAGTLVERIRDGQKSSPQPNQTADPRFHQESRQGTFQESHNESKYEFQYEPGYQGWPISLTLPVRSEAYGFAFFPAFFDGLLPEGLLKEALLRQKKIDQNDFFSQLMAVGEDLVGAVTVRELK